MMSLFDEMLKDENYKRLFDQLSDDQRPIIMNSMRQLVEKIEETIIVPFTFIQKNKGK